MNRPARQCGADFRESLPERVDQQLAAKGAQGTRRTVRQPHDQSRAEDMLAAGLTALGIRGEDLARLPKGQTEKLVLAWWLYGQTTVNRRWVAEQLRMGYETRVSQAVSWVESSREPVVKAMKNKLNQRGP